MKVTNRDPNQITQFEHDEEQNAQRVIVVGQEFSIDSDKIASAIKEGLANIQMPMGVESLPQLEGSLNIVEVEKNVFIPQIEIKTIEVPVIIKEIEIREIEKPIIIEKITTVEVPVLVKEIEFKEIYIEKQVPKWQKVCMVLQTVALFGLIISHFIR